MSTLEPCSRPCHVSRQLGLEVESKRHAKSAALISPDAGTVAARVMRTDEVLVLSTSVTSVSKLGTCRNR